MEQYLDVRGKIFDIERYATGDGPGIRTTVFLKGCPLGCIWCSNPESQSMSKQIMYYLNLCNGCGRCIAQCPQHAIKKDETFGLITDFNKCTACGKCVEGCYFNARELMGEHITVREVMEVINKDKLFFKTSGGGVTFSGGEPFMQPEFLEALLDACKEEDIHTAIETCGCVGWCNIERMLDKVDLIFYDVKHIDSESHRRYTSQGNEQILDNLLRLSKSHSNVIVRIPFIPGVNSDLKVLKEILRFAANLQHVIRIEIMPYHRFGSSKYKGLGRKYMLESVEPVNKQDLQYLVQIGEESGVEVHIGSV
ncbi:glycyl-radical enzyme activating protein [Petroclostridium sp. X23]|uniref:glycyl-radical enzyme activating protein n=1 Tax=Petroclostridium sp. X23 TaxID=3045146 RepID=UPI0024ADA640|nr:glycyl-radical enzyme activating protein [Petroclostridium sp. X23]WHH58064.1 glycyl-radical enzyme activating protein [Petroclostridium sp. X23]